MASSQQEDKQDKKVYVYKARRPMRDFATTQHPQRTLRATLPNIRARDSHSAVPRLSCRVNSIKGVDQTVPMTAPGRRSLSNASSTSTHSQRSHHSHHSHYSSASRTSANASPARGRKVRVKRTASDLERVREQVNIRQATHAIRGNDADADAHAAPDSTCHTANRSMSCDSLQSFALQSDSSFPSLTGAVTGATQTLPVPLGLSSSRVLAPLPCPSPLRLSVSAPKEFRSPHHTVALARESQSRSGSASAFISRTSPVPASQPPASQPPAHAASFQVHDGMARSNWHNLLQEYRKGCQDVAAGAVDYDTGRGFFWLPGPQSQDTSQTQTQQPNQPFDPLSPAPARPLSGIREHSYDRRGHSPEDSGNGGVSEHGCEVSSMEPAVSPLYTAGPTPPPDWLLQFGSPISPGVAMPWAAPLSPATSATSAQPQDHAHSKLDPGAGYSADVFFAVQDGAPLPCDLLQQPTATSTAAPLVPSLTPTAIVQDSQSTAPPADWMETLQALVFHHMHSRQATDTLRAQNEQLMAQVAELRAQLDQQPQQPQTPVHHMVQPPSGQFQ